MKHAYRIKITGLWSAALLLILALALSAQTWTTPCESGVRVEIHAKGMGTRDAHINPVRIDIPDPGTVDSMLVQLVLKVPEDVPPPAQILLTTGAESVSMTLPTIIAEGLGYHYETRFHSGAYVQAEVSGTGTLEYHTPRALVVYLFRRASYGGYHSGELLHKGIWWQASDRPHSYSRSYSVPATLGVKTIHATFVVTDKDSDTNRDIRLAVQAGPVTKEITCLAASAGDEALLETLMLENVPGEVTSVTVTVTSPDESGDSVYWSGIDVSTACEMDLGDAPDPPFPTLLAQDGARHFYRPGYFLGHYIDTESDGQPQSGADGDDLAGIDDEDGVQFLSEFRLSEPATIVVTASAPGWLNGWIDFDHDGHWDEMLEHPIKDHWLTAGVNAITLWVPSSAQIDVEAVARFRFSSQPGLTPSGLARDGEVEDYLIPIYLPVELTLFQASADRQRVVLQWQTASESDNLGFYIYRSESEDGVYTRLNSELVPGAGSSAGTHLYRYADQQVVSGKTYFYRLVDVSTRGQEQWHGPVKVEVATPGSNRLEQNAPNPFNAHTRITYSIKKGGAITLAIYNLQGQWVRNLIQAQQGAGSYSVIWDGRDSEGHDIPTGTYLYILKTPQGELSHRMTLIK